MSLKKSLDQITYPQIQEAVKDVLGEGLLRKEQSGRPSLIWDLSEGELPALGELAGEMVRQISDSTVDQEWTDDERYLLGTGADIAIIVIHRLATGRQNDHHEPN